MYAFLCVVLFVLLSAQTSMESTATNNKLKNGRMFLIKIVNHKFDLPFFVFANFLSSPVPIAQSQFVCLFGIPRILFVVLLWLNCTVIVCEFFFVVGMTDCEKSAVDVGTGNILVSGFKTYFMVNLGYA